MTSTTTALPTCLTDNEHTHDVGCSVEFWRAMGCTDAVVLGGNIECAADHRHAARPLQMFTLPGIRSGAYLPDILGDPSSDASWLAARDVLKEMERRDWTFEFDSWRYPTVNGLYVVSEGVDELPRGIALAFWRAALQEAE